MFKLHKSLYKTFKITVKELQPKESCFIFPKSELSRVDGNRKITQNSEAFRLSWTMFYKQERKK